MESLKLYDTISFYRKKSGLTQEELAKKLGVTNQSVSKWESAQCCPDIGLLPMLADIFEISIDELFRRKNEKEIHYDLCSELPWNDDNTIRIFRTLGKKILESTDENSWINVSFPKDCNEKTRQYFKVEVMGNLNCDASINGDVVCHNNIECNDINGDVKECCGNISCAGDINGGVGCGENLSCAGEINGAVHCGNNVACGDNISGSVSCGDNVTCGKSIEGDVDCGGNVECREIKGNVECQGDIIYK